jgi:ATP citrate (pro-S)-lyase
LIHIILLQSPSSSRRESVNDDKSAPKNSTVNQKTADNQTDVQTIARTLFTNKTKCIIWGMQQRAVQGMMDFDYVCSRKDPSVVAMIYPFTYVLHRLRWISTERK